MCASASDWELGRKVVGWTAEHDLCDGMGDDSEGGVLHGRTFILEFHQALSKHKTTKK
jgi:hypothetical protein